MIQVRGGADNHAKFSRVVAILGSYKRSMKSIEDWMRGQGEQGPEEFRDDGVQCICEITELQDMLVTELKAFRI